MGRKNEEVNKWHALHNVFVQLTVKRWKCNTISKVQGQCIQSRKEHSGNWELIKKALPKLSINCAFRQLLRR